MNRAIVAIIAAAACACASPRMALSPKASKVQVGKGDPANNYELVGPITAQHGAGCGLIGLRGNYNGAVDLLRVHAAEMGADYVSMTTANEPHQEMNCYVNAYIITGMAYRKISASPAPTQIQIVGSPEQKPDILEKLHQLNQLHIAGTLTDEEFAQAKARILQ